MRYQIASHLLNFWHIISSKYKPIPAYICRKVLYNKSGIRNSIGHLQRLFDECFAIHKALIQTTATRSIGLLLSNTWSNPWPQLWKYLTFAFSSIKNRVKKTHYLHNRAHSEWKNNWHLMRREWLCQNSHGVFLWWRGYDWGFHVLFELFETIHIVVG